MKEKGLSWEEILALEKLIRQISYKYSGDPDLANDVFQEVCLKLYTDKKINLNKYDPDKRGAALRNIVRNKVLTVLASKKVGRFPFFSLNMLEETGNQVDQEGDFVPTAKNFVEIMDYEGEVRDDTY